MVLLNALAMFGLAGGLGARNTAGPVGSASVSSFSAEAQGNGTSTWHFDISFSAHPSQTHCSFVIACPASNLCSGNGTVRTCDDPRVYAGWLSNDDHHGMLGVMLMRDDGHAELGEYDVSGAQLEWKTEYSSVVQVYAGPSDFKVDTYLWTSSK